MFSKLGKPAICALDDSAVNNVPRDGDNIRKIGKVNCFLFPQKQSQEAMHAYLPFASDMHRHYRAGSRILGNHFMACNVKLNSFKTQDCYILSIL